jgi:hypothetical protein
MNQETLPDHASTPNKRPIPDVKFDRMYRLNKEKLQCGFIRIRDPV